MVKVLSIIGATASGKSDLAIQVAKKFNGEIVSCDSVQIYKYFDIGSAKPSVLELQEIPHHLVDILEPTVICNAGYWRDFAIPIVEDIANRGKLPIIVGGTGLYLKSLYLGMFEENSRDQEYREFLQERATKENISILYQELQQLDPEYAQKIASTDQLRIIRALEAIKVTQIKFSQLHQYNIKPDWEWTFSKPILAREDIYKRIEQRVLMMLESGLIEETQSLLQRFGKNVPAINTIGYRHVVEYLEASKNFEEMRDSLTQDTRRFAKRQETLFRSLIDSNNILDPEILLNQGIL